MAMMSAMMLQKPNKFGSSSWMQQFKDAVIPMGEVGSDGESDDVGWFDITLHYISLTWKVWCLVSQ